jgi:hypothetical protein
VSTLGQRARYRERGELSEERGASVDRVCCSIDFDQEGRVFSKRALFERKI